MKKHESPPEIPMGLGLALARNRNAFNVFSSMSPGRQSQIIKHSFDIKTKEDMQSFVESMAKDV